MGKNNFAQIEFCDYKGNEKLRKAPDSWRNYCGERVDNFAPKNVYDRKYLQGFDIDFARFPVVVIETDDWGCCTRILETPDDLDKVFAVLRSIRGADGLPVVCTAFTCVSNPDYKKIKKNNYRRYYDLVLDEGFPEPWNGSGILDKMREGMREGIWHPEYHALLHHQSPRLWLQFLRGTGPQSDYARERFEKGFFSQKYHIAEYGAYTAREQFEIIKTGIGYFERLFGYSPRAAVTSDAYPETVLLWSVCGIDTVSLVNAKLNDGTPTVYNTKPWNFQDIYAPMGAIGASSTVVYLGRNAGFELGESADAAWAAICRAWQNANEPAVISCHRAGMIEDDGHLAAFGSLLKHAADSGAVFASSPDLGNLYRQGWFVRQGVLHKYAECSCPVKTGISLTDGTEVKITKKTLGNFKIQKVISYE